MKTPLIPLLLALGFCHLLPAQEIKAPDSLRPNSAPVVPANPATDAAAIEKLAEEAQRSLFESSGGVPADTTAGGGPKLYSGPLSLPSPRPDNPALWDKDSTRKLAVMDVAFGGMRETVMIELFPSDAPVTVSNFIDRCNSGFYNGLAFHRAIEGFAVQTGDPLTSDESARERWGTGGEDKTLPPEIKRPHRIGSVAMARRSDKVNPQRRSNGSQFYIALGNFGGLNGKYTVFGQVVSGLETVQRISQMPVDANDCPIARIEVKSIKIIDHKGPLQPEPEIAGGKRYTKPNSSRGFMGRILYRVW